jgi:glycosyltransferase involved in cell wall biosynthesis
MRILFLLTQDLNSPSGIGRYLPLALELSKMGHSVRIAATHSSYDKLEQRNQLIGKVQVDYVSQMHVYKKGNLKIYYSPLLVLWNSLVSTLKLTRATLSGPVDLICVAKPHPMNSLAGLVGKFRWRCSLVVDVDDDEVATNKFKGGWQKQIVAWFASHAPQWADWVTTNTHYMAHKLERIGLPAEKIFYMPNGIDPDRFREADPQVLTNLRASLGLKDHKVVVYIGSIALVNHPIQLLIEAFGYLQKQMPNSLLMIVGGGEDYEYLQEQTRRSGLSDLILFIGRVNPADVNLYYRLADVSVDPVYDNEVARCRCPLKLFESWGCRVPFVTSDVGDRRLLAGDPPGALLAIPGDPHELARALFAVLNDPQLSHTLATNALERVEKFHWSVLARELDQEIIKRKKGILAD